MIYRLYVGIAQRHLKMKLKKIKNNKISLEGLFLSDLHDPHQLQHSKSMQNLIFWISIGVFECVRVTFLFFVHMIVMRFAYKLDYRNAQEGKFNESLKIKHLYFSQKLFFKFVFQKLKKLSAPLSNAEVCALSGMSISKIFFASSYIEKKIIFSEEIELEFVWYSDAVLFLLGHFQEPKKLNLTANGTIDYEFYLQLLKLQNEGFINEFRLNGQKLPLPFVDNTQSIVRRSPVKMICFSRRTPIRILVIAGSDFASEYKIYRHLIRLVKIRNPATEIYFEGEVSNEHQAWFKEIGTQILKSYEYSDYDLILHRNNASFIYSNPSLTNLVYFYEKGYRNANFASAEQNTLDLAQLQFLEIEP